MSEILWINPEDRALLAAHGLVDLPAFFAWCQGDRLDKSGLAGWRQRWRLRLTDASGVARVVYMKRFERPPLARQIERWRRGRLWTGTAAIEWQNALQLQAMGVRAARPVGFGQQMAGAWERRSFVLLDAVEGQSLERWVPQHVPPPEAERDWAGRHAAIDRLARFIAFFHDSGFVHRDLYLCHVFVRGGEAGYRGAGDDALRLIDLQRVFRPRWRKRRWIVKDLAALNFSAPPDRIGRWDRLRFLCRYVRCCDRSRPLRKLMRLVELKTAQIAGRNPRPMAGTWAG